MKRMVEFIHSCSELESCYKIKRLLKIYDLDSCCKNNIPYVRLLQLFRMYFYESFIHTEGITTLSQTCQRAKFASSAVWCCGYYCPTEEAMLVR